MFVFIFKEREDVGWILMESSKLAAREGLQQNSKRKKLKKVAVKDFDMHSSLQVLMCTYIK